MKENRDEQLIGGKFMKVDLPKRKRYLLRYFESEAGSVFVSYFLMFNSYTNFVDHTGYRVTRRRLRQFKHRMVLLEKAMDDARSSGDFSLVAEIESGKFKL